jgi:hypothetical protein
MFTEVSYKYMHVYMHMQNSYLSLLKDLDLISVLTLKFSFLFFSFQVRNCQFSTYIWKHLVHISQMFSFLTEKKNMATQ